VFNKLLSLIILLFIFSGSIFAEGSDECSYKALKEDDFEKMRVTLEDYVKNSVNVFLKDGKKTFDPNIPFSLYITFSDDGGAYIDLLFGVEKGHVFTSSNIPYNVSTVGFGFRKEEDKCVVHIIEEGPSGIVRLWLRKDVNIGYSSFNLARDNDPVLYSFSLPRK
jgi:hypothetical protein